MGGLHILKIGFGGNYSASVLDDGAKKSKADSRGKRNPFLLGNYCMNIHCMYALHKD